MSAKSIDVLVDLTSLETTARYTGTGRYVNELGRALLGLSATEKKGLELAGLTAIEGDSLLGPLDWPGSPEPRWDAAHEVQYLMKRRTRLWLTLRRIRPRIVHMPYAVGTPRGSSVPRVVTCLDLIPLVLHRDYLAGRPVYRRVLQATQALRFHTARRVQAISQHTADDMMRLLGVPASKIDIVLLGVDLERYRPPEGAEAVQAATIRAKYELGKRPYVFYMGAADPRKNVDTLLRAFAEARVPDLELVLIGKLRASDRAHYDRALEQAGHPENVRFMGFVPEADLPAIIAGARAFVFCSSYEGFGNVPIEAMACGCPVITTGLTSMRETVGDIGLIVPPRDVAATADAIRRIARDDALHRDLSQAGVKRAQRFSWRNTALDTIESYVKALG